MKIPKEAMFLSEESFQGKKDPSKTYYKPLFLVDDKEIVEGFENQPTGLAKGDVVNIELVFDAKDAKYVNISKNF